jgi:hypothetical protein
MVYDESIVDPNTVAPPGSRQIWAEGNVPLSYRNACGSILVCTMFMYLHIHLFHIIIVIDCRHWWTG